MKKKMAGAMAALLMFAACQMPAFAAEVPEGGTDYGSFYDETGVMNTEVLQELGEVTLPSVGGAYGVDLHVDVLDYADGRETMEEMAARIYEEYGYGDPDTLDGLSLTLLLGTDGDSYTLPEGNWVVYGAGEDQELMEAIAASVSEQVAPYLTEGAWDGDLASDQATLEQAVSAVSDAVQQACEDNGIQKAGALLNYVTDVAGLLSDEQLQTLEQKAQEVSEQYNCGVYAVTVDDYQNYDDSGVFDTAVAVYHGCNLGEGSDRDGILLLLSMADRDYAMFVYGPFANEAFNSYGQEQLEQVFLDDFADNDWYNGFTDYIEKLRILHAAGRGRHAGQRARPQSAGQPWPGLWHRLCHRPHRVRHHVLHDEICGSRHQCPGLRDARGIAPHRTAGSVHPQNPDPQKN